MFTTMIHKELRAIILSPKFTASFAVCTILLLLSVYIGIREYRQAEKQYETATKLSEQRLQEQTSWHSLHDKVYHTPNPMQIFVSGLSYDIGRWSEISAFSTVKLKNSAYSDDPIFAVFRFIDFAFIVQIVFSLLAILFTYDSVNGERERGTLRLVFANAVPRARFLMSKCIGSWLGLVVPICIPILLSLVLVNLYGIPLSDADWGKVALLVGVSLVYVTLFTVLGVFVSTLSKSSNISFLLSLVIWVALVLIIPRAGVMAAGQFVSVPQLAEIEGQRDGYAKDRWAQYYKEMEKRLLDENTVGETNDTGKRDEEFDEEAMWARMQAEDSARKAVQRSIEDHEVRLLEDCKQRKAVQQRLGFTLSRFSPASSYQLAAMNLVGTDIAMKTRYEDALNTYRSGFVEFIDRNQAESGQMGGVMISIDSDKGVNISSSRDNVGLDLSDRPSFIAPVQRFGGVMETVVVDIGLLVIGIFLIFAGAFVSFLRYDLR